MSPTHPTKLSEKQIEQFHREGYVMLGRLTPPEAIEALCNRIDQIMLGNLVYPGMLMQLDPADGATGTDQTRSFKGSTLKYRKIQDLDLDPLFLEFMRHPMFRDLTRRIIGENISVFRCMFFNKPAGSKVPLGWHQDGSDGWGMNIAPKITVWVALDATNRANGCLKIVPGSHRSVIAGGKGLSPEQVMQYAPESKVMDLEMEKGETVLLHNWALHSSGENHTNGPRRAFSVCYIDAASQQTATGKSFTRIFPEYARTSNDADTAITF